MILKLTYRGHEICVLPIGKGPFHWSYSVDGGAHMVSKAEFSTEDLALREGFTSAKLSIDRLYIAGDDAFSTWEGRLHG
jgi:hypothetical protein